MWHVHEPTHPMLYLRAANHRRGFKSVVCETHFFTVIIIFALNLLSFYFPICIFLLTRTLEKLICTQTQFPASSDHSYKLNHKQRFIINIHFLSFKNTKINLRK
jgi:hypothetical protein